MYALILKYNASIRQYKMTIYECPRCPYKTKKITSYNYHINRVYRCNKTKVHKNIKPLLEPRCELCDTKFSRPDALTRHNELFHPEIIVNKNINKPHSKTNAVINNNNTIIINNIVNIDIPKIYGYLHNDWSLDTCTADYFRVV